MSALEVIEADAESDGDTEVVEEYESDELMLARVAVTTPLRLPLTVFERLGELESVAEVETLADTDFDERTLMLPLADCEKVDESVASDGDAVICDESDDEGDVDAAGESDAIGDCDGLKVNANVSEFAADWLSEIEPELLAVVETEAETEVVTEIDGDAETDETTEPDARGDDESDEV
jgi:hypothetical protein